MVRPKRYIEQASETPKNQEDRIANRLGGKRVRGSGASMYSKGDVRDVSLSGNDFLVECKQTDKASISIKWDWLRKISKEAMAVGKNPALTIEIKGGKFDPNTDRDWVLLPVRIIEQIKERG